jgi:hypothetical protein
MPGLGPGATGATGATAWPVGVPVRKVVPSPALDSVPEATSHLVGPHQPREP